VRSKTFVKNNDKRFKQNKIIPLSIFIYQFLLLFITCFRNSAPTDELLFPEIKKKSGKKAASIGRMWS